MSSILLRFGGIFPVSFLLVVLTIEMKVKTKMAPMGNNSIVS